MVCWRAKTVLDKLVEQLQAALPEPWEQLVALQGPELNNNHLITLMKPLGSSSYCRRWSSFTTC